MLKDITIGQFFPGRSIVHKLDPRFKILLTLFYVVILFLVRNYFSLIVLTVLAAVSLLISRIPLKTIWKSLRAIVFIVVFTALFQILYNDKGAVLWKPFPDISFSITSGGVSAAVFLVFRLIELVLMSSLLTYTTSPTLLTDAIERLLTPLKLFHVKIHSLAMMMTIALRFIPTLIEELDIIMSAQKARGAKLEAGSLPERAKALVSVFVPLFVSAFRRAADLAVAMECRCYTDGANRSRLRIMKCRPSDVVILLIFLSVLGVSVFFSFFQVSDFILFQRVI